MGIRSVLLMQLFTLALTIESLQHYSRNIYAPCNILNRKSDSIPNEFTTQATHCMAPLLNK